MPSILVTGANRGLGLELCRQYGALGWRVYGTCRHPDAATDLAALVGSSAGEISLHRLDVTDKEQIGAVANELAGAPIDILMNNAGTVDSYGTGVLDGNDDPDIRNYDFQVWRDIMEVNLYAVGEVTGAFVENVAASDKKMIVMMASGLSSIENTWMGGRYAYRTSKAALNMFMRGLGAWLEPRGIAVVSIAPGWTRTELGGPNAMNSVEEAIEGMRTVVDRLTIADTGTYWDYDGSRLPF